MGKTYWCHEPKRPGIICVNNINGVCTEGGIIENLFSPCGFRKPYPPSQENDSFEDFCKRLDAYHNMKPNPDHTLPASMKKKPPNRGSSVQPAPKKVIKVVIHRSYNPVEKAYEILTKAHFDNDTDLTGAHIAMEEAIGYLGEALAE